MLEKIFKQYGIVITGKDGNYLPFNIVMQDMYLLLNTDNINSIMTEIMELENSGEQIF